LLLMSTCGVGAGAECNAVVAMGARWIAAVIDVVQGRGAAGAGLANRDFARARCCAVDREHILPDAG